MCLCLCVCVCVCVFVCVCASVRVRDREMERQRMGFVWTAAYHNYKPCRQPWNHGCQEALILCGSESSAFFIYRRSDASPPSPSDPLGTRDLTSFTQREKYGNTSVYAHLQINRHSNACTCPHTRAFISQQKRFFFSVGNWDKLLLAGENVCAQRANLTVWQPTKRAGRLACALEWPRSRIRK